MTDSGSSPRRTELAGVSLRPRPRSASEAIRRRVNQRLAFTGNSFEPPELIQTSYSAQTTYSKPELTGPSMPVSIHREPHPLKRKKTPRVDNRGQDPSPEASSHSQRKGALVTTRPHSRHHDSEQIDQSSDDEHTFTGPIAAGEFDRLRKEVDSLKQALHESKRINKRQSKKYDEAKAELSSTLQALKDHESEVASLKERYTKREELVSTIESSVQCQICMDLPDRPFALAPCGHILCLACLQEWFRKAPPALDDIDIDPEELTDSRYVLMRSKSCPICRTVVKRRPVPVFMVRAIAGALRKAKCFNASLMPQHRDSETSRDPWKGIFPSSEDDDDGANEDGHSSTEESESDFDLRVGVPTVPRYFRRRAVRRAMFRAMYSSTISDEDEEAEDSSESDENGQVNTPYVLPRWAPPSVDVDLAEFDISEEQDPVSTFKLLQRGCTWEMVQNYYLSYDHSSGIVLSLRSLNHLYASDDEEGGPEPEGMHRIFLGWNIALDDVDVDGEAFICKVIEDIKRSPFRWEVTPRSGVPGALDVRKLFPADEVVDYDTTDTEVWMDSDDF